MVIPDALSPDAVSKSLLQQCFGPLKTHGSLDVKAELVHAIVFDAPKMISQVIDHAHGSELAEC